MVYSESCKIYVDIDGKSNRVRSVDDVHKLYVTFCERIGNNDNYVFPTCANVTKIKRTRPVATTKIINNHPVSDRMQVKAPRQNVPYSNRTFFNSNHRNLDSYRNVTKRQTGYKGNHSTGYSVYERPYY